MSSIFTISRKELENTDEHYPCLPQLLNQCAYSRGSLSTQFEMASAFSTAQEFKTQIQCHFLHKTLPHIPSLKLLLTVDLGIIAPDLTLYTTLLSATVTLTCISYPQEMVNSLRSEIMPHSPLLLYSLCQVPTKVFLLVDL